MKSASNRYGWTDYAKGIAILLVLYRHVFEGIKNAGMDVGPFLYLEHANIAFFSFRMPLFFIIAGIFISKSLAKRGLLSFVESKMKTILYVYLIWTVLQITMQILLSKYVNADRGWMDYLYIFYAPRYLDQFWYLHTLFFVLILYAFVKEKLRVTMPVQLAIGLALFFMSGYFYRTGIQLYFLNDIFHHYIFMATGDIVSRFFFKPDTFKKLGRWWVLLATLPFFVLAQYFFLKINIAHIEIDKGYQYIEFFMPWLYLLIAYTGCFFVIIVCFILQNLNWLPSLRAFGQYSLYIYASHVFATSFVRILLVRFMGVDFIPVILAAGILAGAAVPVWFYRVSSRIGLRWLFVWPEKGEGKLISMQGFETKKVE